MGNVDIQIEKRSFRIMTIDNFEDYELYFLVHRVVTMCKAGGYGQTHIPKSLVHLKSDVSYPVFTSYCVC